MRNVDRKAAIREYKARKIARGVFAVRCLATAKAWVGASPNLAGARNAQWFTLRQGLHRNARLQAEWNAHGESAFEFQVLEQIDDDVSDIRLRDVLKERKLRWVGQLGAEALLP